MDDQISENTNLENSTGINPAWNDFLSVIPTEYHEKVTPVLKSWDEGVNAKLQNVQSKYANYEAYEPFVQNNVPAEDLQYGYGILQALYKDPVATVKAIQESFNITPESVSGQGASEDDSSSIDPRYSNLHPEVIAQLQYQQQTLDTLSKLMLKQGEEAMAAAEAQKLDSQINALKKQHGDFNEEVVLSLALQMNNDIPAAFKYYTDTIQKELSKRNTPPAPRLLGSGGSAPDNSVDPRKLNPRQTVDLVTSILKSQRGAS